MKIGDNWNGWTIEAQLGEGQFGKVYKLSKSEFGHTYESALKVIRIPKNESEYWSALSEGMDEASVTSFYLSVVEQITSECALMYELRGNSNIVSYEGHKVEEAGDGFGWNIFIQMELLRPLTKVMTEKVFTETDTIRLGIDICKALEACAKYNIIHRDIKPENVFQTKIGDYKLGDFGVARKLENATAAMSKKGTYTYMAPEVYRDLPYNLTVDIYSLGIMMYRLMNKNRAPFYPPSPQPITYSDRENARDLRMQGAQLSAPCDASDEFAEIIMKACSFKSYDRYQSATELRQCLERLLEMRGESYEPEVRVVADPTKPDPGDITLPLDDNKTSDGSKKRAIKWPVLVVAALCVILAVGGVVWSMLNSGESYSISMESFEIGAGGERTLSIDGIDEDDTVVWESSNPAVATVDEDGTVHAVAEGEATIDATIGNSQEPLHCQVTVSPLSIPITVIDLGGSKELYVKGTDTEKVVWMVDKPELISFNEKVGQKVTATATGFGVINVSAKVDGQKIEKEILIRLSKTNELAADKKEVIVKGDEEIVHACWTYDGNIYASWDDASVIDVEWGDYYAIETINGGGYQKIIIHKKKKGTALLTLTVKDNEGNEYADIEPVTIKVVCE